MTNQEIFDRIYLALYKQGRPSVDESGNCLYRSKNGLKCAAGHIIPDELYHTEYEGTTFECLNDTINLLDFDREQVQLIASLQSIHDSNTMFYEVRQRWFPIWKENMAKYANENGLNIPDVSHLENS